MFDIVLTTGARREYDRLDAVTARRVAEALDRLAQNPYRGPGIARLSPGLRAQYRRRVGDWRILYDVDVPRSRVIVLAIKRRAGAYRRR